MKEVLLGGLGVIAALFTWALYLAGFAIHAWTIVIAYNWSGLGAAAMSLAMPVLAQIYWIVRLWWHHGVFLNPFSVMCLLYVAAWLIPLSIGGLGIYLDHRGRQT